MRIELLGPVRAWRGEDELTLGSAHRRAVLAVLATRANRVVSRAELIDAVWGEHAPASANGSIYTYVSGLRAALEPDRSRRSTAQVLASAGSGYSLQLAENTVDVDRFDALREQAKRRQAARDPAGARKALDAALGLWHGDALDGIPGPFAASQRSRLAELRLTTLERRAQVVLDSGGHHAIVDELTELTGEHPLREGLHGLLLLALYRSGRRADALKVFRELRATTVETLGTEPGPALTALNEQILADDPALVRTPESPGGPAKPIPIVARPRPSRPRVFVDRETETRTLRAAVRKVAEGIGGSIWIEGEPGIGKSALLAHALAETPGCQLAWASADELGQRFPLRVILDCLDVTAHSADPRRAELARAARRSENITSSEPVPAAVEGALSLVEELCTEGPLILVADELQWADPASLLVWQRLSRATRRLPLLLIGACRPVPRRPELELLRAALPECGTEKLVLEPLSDVDVHDLITGLTGVAPTPALLGFGLSSAGNPLYVKEIVATLSREGALDVERAASAIPATLVSMISHHLTFLSARTRKSLRWAALFGEAFTSADLAAALGREVEELADVIDEARAAGVFAEAHGRLAFRHPLVRRALYDKTPAAVRVALHRQLAEALANAGAPAERVAGQLTAAPVPVDPWVRDWLIAEIATLAPRAPLAAMQLLRRATTSGAVVGDFKESLTATMARLMFWLGHEPEAEASYVCARTADSERAAEMRWILAHLHYRRGDLPRAIGGISEALRDNELSDEWRLRHNSLLSAVLPAGSLLSIFLPSGGTGGASPDQQAADLERALEAVSVVPKLATLHRMLLDDTTAALHAAGRPATSRPIPHPRLPQSATEQDKADTGSALVQAYRLGHWDEALAELATALGSGPVIASYLLGPPGPARLLNGVAALIAGHRGEPAEARAHLRAAGEQPSRDSADTEGVDLVLAAGALIAEQEDRPDYAFDLLATMLEPDYAAHDARFAWLPTLVRLAMDLGERGRARFATLLSEGTPGQEAPALRCRALLDGDPAPMLTAAERYRIAGRRLEFAQAMEDAAILLIDRGRMSEAAASLRMALVSYTELGARWDVQRAERRMRGRRRG